LTREPTPNRYDEVPYPSGAFEQTHPGRLAMLATLFGMSPPPIETCRVLELGCGSGGNILPMAYAMPRATFLGIDYSAREISDGKPWIERLRLTNIKLEHKDILEFEAEPSSFDYIIAHGVFSWVPREVQDKIFALCERALAPSGVAYVSFAALPGCHIRRLVRDLMRFHTRAISHSHARASAEPSQRVAQAKAVASFAARSVPQSNPVYAAILKGEVERIAKMSDEVLLHDDLADVNEPLYFHEFIERAARYGLKFLSEALFADMQDQIYPAEAREALRQSGDIVVAEQYMDFLGCRAFRQTLLCRQDVPLLRQLTPAHIKVFGISSNSSPVSASPDVKQVAIERFKNPTGVVVGMDHPLSKAAMVHLSAIAPKAVSFEELLRAAIEVSEGAPRAPTPEDEETIGEAVLMAFSGNMVDLHVAGSAFVTEPGERPKASELARLQAEEGARVTSLTQRNIVIDDLVALTALRLLDGRRDRAELLEALVDAAAGGGIEIMQGGAAISDRSELRAYMEGRLDGILRKMARFALLVG
jgi:methyltransferase-like protein/SAM-dependent methyltransferase